jgi:hypothetical protein
MPKVPPDTAACSDVWGGVGDRQGGGAP